MPDRADYAALVASRPELFDNPPGSPFEVLLAETDIQQAEAQALARLQQAGAPAGWSEVGVAFRDQYLILLRDAVRYTDGSLGTYIRLVNPYPQFLGVVVLPVWQSQILLIRHFRHATRRWHWEIPRGFGAEADPAEGARRELAEEIGASGIRLTALGEIHPDTGASDSRAALFHAEVASYGQPEAIEGIAEIQPTPVPQFEHMICDGVLTDGYALAAYAHAKARGLL